MWICSFLSVYVLLLGFSICSQKHYIGYSIHSMNGMLLITSMTFYLFSLLALTCPHILFSSTKFCRHLGCRKLLRKIQMVVSSFILDLSSIPARWKSLSLPTKSSARSMPSAFSYRPHRCHLRTTPILQCRVCTRSYVPSLQLNRSLYQAKLRLCTPILRILLQESRLYTIPYHHRNDYTLGSQTHAKGQTRHRQELP